MSLKNLADSLEVYIETFKDHDNNEEIGSKLCGQYFIHYLLGDGRSELTMAWFAGGDDGLSVDSNTQELHDSADDLTELARKVINELEDC